MSVQGIGAKASMAILGTLGEDGVSRAIALGDWNAISKAKGVGRVTQAIADRALTRLGVDDLGLDNADRRYLRLIAESYGGGPVGVETLSAALSESRDALEEVIEPYLLQKGLIQRTPRGRMLATAAWKHLGLDVPKGQTDLFG